jgi:hypothetical protein
MIDVLKHLGAVLGSLCRSHAGREAEILFLRQQLLVLKRSAPGRIRLRSTDRLIFVCLYRLFPSLLEAAVIFKPETLVRWHRGGFRLFWRWKSRRRPGRPAVPTGIRVLVRQMSRENPLWGAPRIHGELLKLGIEMAQSTVAKYMGRRRGPPSQGWKTFLNNHAPDVAAIDLFVVPTIGFKLLYGLIILNLGRRRLVWANVTANPTPSGSRGRSPRHSRGMKHLDTSCVIAMHPTAPSSRGASRPWASATDRPRRARRGKTAMSND